VIHQVVPHGERLVVGYAIPGTDLVTAVSEFPAIAAAAAYREAARLTRETEPEAPTPAGEDRRTPSGFYGEEFGDA
jgi:hypothetical protein